MKAEHHFTYLYSLNILAAFFLADMYVSHILYFYKIGGLLNGLAKKCDHIILQEIVVKMFNIIDNIINSYLYNSTHKLKQI